MLNSSSAPKSLHTLSTPSLRLPPTAKQATCKHITAYFCTSLRARALNQTASSWPETCYAAGPHAKLELCAEIFTHSEHTQPQTATYRKAGHMQAYYSILLHVTASPCAQPDGLLMAGGWLHSWPACYTRALRRNPHTLRARQASNCHLPNGMPDNGLQHTHCTCQKRHTRDASKEVK